MGDIYLFIKRALLLNKKITLWFFTVVTNMTWACGENNTCVYKPWEGN